ncbi:MAG: tyrosine-type recombinase/integrase [Fuerstiella sp.]
MSKRANGEGTVFQRESDGRWVGRISLGQDATGKRIRKTVYGKTQKEALDKIDDLKQQAKLNMKAIVARESLAAYLNWWLENDVAVNRASKTYEEYEASVRLQSIPFIGHIKLSKIDGDDLIAWQAKLKRNKFSNNQRLRSIRVLRNALNKAVKHRKIPFNPCIVLDIPKVERKEVVPLEPEKCHELFDECMTHRLGDAVTLAIMTGLRLREIFGLDWRDINLAEGVLTVRKTLEELSKKTAKALGTGTLNEKPPKSKKSRRVITLEPIAIKALRNRLKKAKAEGFDPAEVPIVFPDTIGGRLRASNFYRMCWYPIREKLDIRHVKFHDLRHTQASLMLYAGVDMKVIQERLGHADFGTTANMYAHMMQDSQAKATEKLDTLMAGSKPTPKPVGT